MDILHDILMYIDKLNLLIIQNTAFNITIVNSIMFFVSFFGLMIFCKNVLNIKLELIPVFLISLIICILNFSGLYGDLKLAVQLIYICGFFAFIIVPFIYLIKVINKTNKPIIFTNASFITLIIFTALLIYVLHDVYFSHYDNFSHWAHVVREMLMLDSMPDSSSANLMDFTTYPLGASLFIYYGCKIIGISDGIMLIIQGFFIVSCLLPLFAFDKRFKIVKIPIIILIYIILLIEPKIFNLLVDVLLACLGFASFMIIVYYRKSITSAFFVVLPTVVALVLVKNSGIFFAVIDVVLLFYLALKSNSKANIIYSVLLGLSIGLALWTWNVHCDAVFPQIVGKHSMTTSNFESIFAEKSMQDIKTIALLMKERLLDKYNVFIRAIITMNILALCGRWWHKFIQEDDRKITKIAIVLDIIFIVYFIGIFAMYVFSMPLDEAMYLAGYERYIMTIIVYIILIFTAYWVYIANTDLTSVNKPNRYGLLMLYCFVVLIGVRFGRIDYNIFELKEKYMERNPMNAVMIENNMPTDKSYVMYVPEKYSEQYEVAYFNYLLKYKLRTSNVYPLLNEGFRKADDKDVIELIRDYDYFIIYDEDEYINDFAKKHLNKSSDVIGCYRIDNYSEIAY